MLTAKAWGLYRKPSARREGAEFIELKTDAFTNQATTAGLAF